MQRLEVSGAVRPIYGSLGVKRLTTLHTSSSYILQPPQCAENLVADGCPQVYVFPLEILIMNKANLMLLRSNHYCVCTVHVIRSLNYQCQHMHNFNVTG